MSAPTSVYRYYDADRRLIYVGITGKGMIRQTQHNSQAEWWKFVSTQEVEHVDSRPAALHRERELIERFRPPFNREHNSGWEKLRADYLARFAPKPTRCGHCAGCELDADGIDLGEFGDGRVCRWEYQHDPDEEPVTCPKCGSVECVYSDGFEDGQSKGWRAGYNDAHEQTRAMMVDRYLPVSAPDLLLRAVIDGGIYDRHRDGTLSWGNPAVEQARRALDAAIAERGVATLVNEARAASEDPWATPSASEVIA